MSSNNASRAALAVASGLALGLAFPKFDYGLLAWVALVPLFYVIEGESMRRVFAWAYLQGFACYLVELYWIPIPLHDFADVRMRYAIFPMLALAGIVAINTAAAIWAGEFVARRMRIPAVLTMPVAWATVEWIRTYFPVGFPWNLLGYAAYRNLELIQFAEFTGVYGVSALIVFFNAVVYVVIFRRGVVSPADRQPERVDRVDDCAGRVRRVANQQSQERAVRGELQGRDGAGQYPADRSSGIRSSCPRVTTSIRTKQ